MRSGILPLLTCLLLLSTFSMTGQVTITQENFVLVANQLDSTWTLEENLPDFPTEGPNQVWDYSGMSVGTLGTDSLVEAGEAVGLENAVYYTYEPFTFELGGFPYQVESNLYVATDENGWYRNGRTIEAFTLPLTPLTGQPDDRIDYQADTTAFVGRQNFLKFPTTYEDQWDEERYIDLHYEVTAVPFGLNQTPAFTRFYYRQEREVVGYGTLILPDPQGGAQAPQEGLLVRVTRTDVDSVFLGGAPAPLELLSQFGITQGEVFQDSFYAVYVPGVPTAAALFDTEDMFNSRRIIYRFLRPDIDTRVGGITLPQAKCFPNPTVGGTPFTITLEESLTTGQVRFYDALGRSGPVIEYTALGEHMLQITLPATTAAGPWLYHLTDQDDQLIGVGKVLVH